MTEQGSKFNISSAYVVEKTNDVVKTIYKIPIWLKIVIVFTIVALIYYVMTKKANKQIENGQCDFITCNEGFELNDEKNACVLKKK